ncbi:hypothetical protein AB0A74_04135 [Saccharothrix sp. NPDC042600]|uniref:hypothetical protein n=1 Tax=Saccharothrix TaxID=2071 RepID=UPI0033FD28BC|nr:hypothetical protein GCM10017745_88800 [Saccharothrix mutabilis subsp. capreolus]
MKRVIIGDQSWGLADADAARVVSDIEQAMTDGTVVRLPLLAEGRPVTVFFNGKLALTAVVDDDSGARPTEISG